MMHLLVYASLVRHLLNWVQVSWTLVAFDCWISVLRHSICGGVPRRTIAIHDRWNNNRLLSCVNVVTRQGILTHLLADTVNVLGQADQIFKVPIIVHRRNRLTFIRLGIQVDKWVNQLRQVFLSNKQVNIGFVSVYSKIAFLVYLPLC